MTVSGPPAANCWRNKGTTLPLEPNTLPKRTMVKQVHVAFCANACKTSSAMRLLAPMMLVGRTALSVEINTKRRTPLANAACAVLRVPNTLFKIP